ncbi:MAG: prealbumin-like fold domain-containing protein [Oscillospiraceae bacterium]|nr:prealbumin-like fold domain-containing protein [Oscillospiraceae bacterium]
MRNIVYSYIDRFRHERHERLVLGSVLLLLAIIVSITVYWQLRYTGITMTNETYCGYEEHTHTEECYEYTLICELEESEGHSHTDECYEEQLVLICTLEESEGHIHDDTCYDEEGNLVCGLEESLGHTHDESCYETQLVLVCELEESEGHIHTEECYEKTLICGLEEHTHTVECLVDLNADVEDESIWEATLPELTGDLRTDVVAIARSQLGYTESTANYTLGEDGITHYGYTRYGEWYGSIYSDWDSIFVAFCLDYAGIADEFTYNAGAYAWSVDLTNLGYFMTADSYTPTSGDIAFIDTDADGRANISAIVVSVSETSITVIQGNYSVTDSESNTIDLVAFVSYSTETSAAENELVTLSSGTESETTAVTPAILGYANISPEAAAEEVTEETVIDENSDESDEDEVELGEEPADETPIDEEIVAEEETEIVEPILSTSAAVDYVSQVNELYTLAMSLTAGDTASAATIWDSLMVIWEQIYAEEEASTLTLTSEEYDNVNALTDEVYYYFVETVGYDPYEPATLEETGSSSDTIYTVVPSENDNTSASELSNTTVTWTASNVSYDNGTFTLELLANFTITGTQIQPTYVAGTTTVESYATYYIYLPDGVEVAESILGEQQLGTNESGGNVTFHYYYRYDQTTDSYYIEVVFDVPEYYTANNSNVELTGKIDYSHYTISAEDVTPGSGSIIITYGDVVEIVIPTSEIDKEENESWLQDITVTKASQAYDTATNSITYTVYISSTSGSGVITLDDVMSVVANQSYSGSLTVESVDVESVYYQQNIYYSDNYGNSWTSWSSGTQVTSSGNAIESTTTVGSDYTVSDTPTTGSDVTITLAPLAGATPDGTTITTGDRYAITYTVTFEPSSGTIDATVTNDATATSTKDGDTVTDEATSTRRVSTSTVSKTHKYDSDSGLMVWTITFNANGSNIAGYTLSDDMLSQLIGDLSVEATYNGSTIATADGTDYTVNYDNGVITSITFNAVDDDGDGNYDSNNRAYTITYTTDTGLGMGEESKWIYNEVEIYEDKTLVDEDEDSAWVYSSGSIAKSVVAANTTSTATLNGESVETRILTWTSTLTVPSSGIDAGSTIQDCLNGNWGFYSLSSTKQWFNYDQLKAFMDTLTGTNGALTVIDSATGDTKYTLSYDDGNGYTIKVYGYPNDGSNGDWIDYSDILADPTSYENYVFTEWEITLNEDLQGPGTITFTYSTTANISNIETTQNYTNYIYVNNLSASATYTERSLVYKTDGSGNSNTTTTTTSTGDGTVTWKVYVNADGASGEFIITDTLPAGVTLSSVYIQLGYSGYYTTLAATTDNNVTTLSDGTLNNQTISGTVTKNSDNTSDVVITIPYAAYSIIASNASNPYIMLTYTTTIDDWDETYEFDASNSSVTFDDSTNTYTRSYELYNSVSVTLAGNNFGEDEQQQNINHTKQGEITNYTHDEVEKSGDYSKLADSSNMVSYEVLLNLDAEDLLDGGDTLTFTDVLYSYDYTTSTGSAVYPTLVYNTVKFYKLYKLTVTEDISGTDTVYTYTYTDDSSNTVTLYSGTTDITNWSGYSSSIYSYTEVDGKTTYYYKVELDLDWDFVHDSSQNWNITSTLTAEIPDNTAILVNYTYYITAIGSSWISVRNDAKLTGDSNTKGSDSAGDNYYYTDPTSFATISSADGFTIYKSGAHTSEFIAGVTFALYKYDSGSKTWEEVNYSGTLTTDSFGYLSISPYDDANELYDWYSPNTLYCLKETDGPEGYLIDTETMYYFFWYDDSPTADPSYSDMVYPDGVTLSDVSVVTIKSNTTINVYNQPITTFTLNKVSSSDLTTTIPGATFALYRWSGSREAWVKIGTYTTDANGKISITYDEDLFDYNRAYRIVEQSTADGYNVAWEDITEFYFYWSSDEDGGSIIAPDGWGETGSKYASVIDLSEGSQTVTATNSPTSTNIEVKKVWIGTDGEIETDISSYTATVQLYYYLADANGNPVRLSTSSPASTTELITLTTTTGTVSDTTATLYSNTNEASLTAGSYNTLNIDSTKLIASIYDEDYSSGYVEVVVAGGDYPTYMSLILQYVDGGGSYQTLTSVSPSISEEIVGNTSYYTLTYSFEAIRSAVASAGFTYSDIKSFCLNLNSFTSAGTLQSIKALGSAFVGNNKASLSADVNATHYNWLGSYFWEDPDIKEALQTDGARIRITYDYTNGSEIIIGLQTSDGNFAQYPAVSSSGVAEIAVSDFPTTVTDSYGNTSYFSWDNWKAIYLQESDSSRSLIGTITSIEVLVLASSETTTLTYAYASTDDNSKTLTDSTWYGFFDIHNYTYILSAIQTDGAVVYIEYTCTDTLPTNTGFGIQYYDGTSYDYVWYKEIASQYELGSGYIAIPISNITSGNCSLEDYNALYFYDYSGDSVTINSVSILIPYDLTESISGTISSDAQYSVVLYEPVFPSGSVAISNTNSGQWNAITNSASEPTYDYTAVNSTVSHNLITGYAFLDAVFSDVASTIELTVQVTNSASDAATALKSLSLIIQGDKSVGTTDDGYVAIGTVSPTSVTLVSGTTDTYTVTYNTSELVSALKNFNSAYTNAAAVYADYNALCVSMGNGDTTFTANVTGLSVNSVELDASETYIYSSLIGTEYDGIPYTDENGTTFIYTLNESNNWTVAVANLPMTYTVTDSQTGETTTYYRYYYFVEISHSGGTVAYTTTYSQREGENGGGEIVISNIATTFVFPTTGWSGDFRTLYEFGVMLILLALFGAGAYRNISRIKKSLVSDPVQHRVDPEGHNERLPDVRNRKFVIPRIVRKGDTRAGPEDG